MDVVVGDGVRVYVEGGVKVNVGDGVSVGDGVKVDVGLVAVGVGVIVPPQPGIALQTFNRPPVAVMPARLETKSTLLRIALLTWSTVKPACPGAERIKAAAPATCGVAMDVPL